MLTGVTSGYFVISCQMKPLFMKSLFLAPVPAFRILCSITAKSINLLMVDLATSSKYALKASSNIVQMLHIFVLLSSTEGKLQTWTVVRRITDTRCVDLVDHHKHLRSR